MTVSARSPAGAGGPEIRRNTMSNKKFQLTNLATGKSCELDALSGSVGRNNFV